MITTALHKPAVLLLIKIPTTMTLAQIMINVKTISKVAAAIISQLIQINKTLTRRAN